MINPRSFHRQGYAPPMWLSSGITSRMAASCTASTWNENGPVFQNVFTDGTSDSPGYLDKKDAFSYPARIDYPFLFNDSPQNPPTCKGTTGSYVPPGGSNFYRLCYCVVNKIDDNQQSIRTRKSNGGANKKGKKYSPPPSFQKPKRSRGEGQRRTAGRKWE